MPTPDPDAMIGVLRAELAEQAAHAAAAVAEAQDRAAQLMREHASEVADLRADLARLRLRIAALERRVWWLDRWELDPEAVMRTFGGRALWAAVRAVRAVRRG